MCKSKSNQKSMRTMCASYVLKVHNTHYNILSSVLLHKQWLTMSNIINQFKIAYIMWRIPICNLICINETNWRDKILTIWWKVDHETSTFDRAISFKGNHNLFSASHGWRSICATVRAPLLQFSNPIGFFIDFHPVKIALITWKLFENSMRWHSYSPISRLHLQWKICINIMAKILTWKIRRNASNCLLI